MTDIYNEIMAGMITVNNIEITSGNITGIIITSIVAILSLVLVTWRLVKYCKKLNDPHWREMHQEYKERMKRLREFQARGNFCSDVYEINIRNEYVDYL